VTVEDGRLVIRLADKQEAGRISVRVTLPLADTCENPPLVGIIGMQGTEVGVPNAQGSFLSDPLEPGPYNVMLLCDGKIDENRACQVKPDEIAFLEFGDIPHGSIRVTGTLTRGSVPFEDLGFVSLVRLGQEGNQPVNSTQFEGSRFSLAVREAGSGELMILPYTREGAHSTGFYRALKWGGDTRDRHLDLDLPGAVLDVRVVDAESHSPLPGADIELVPPSASYAHGAWHCKGNPGAKSREDGEAYLPYLPAGAYTLAVRKQGYAASEQSLEIAEGAILSLEVWLCPKD
jgi:hypothetical protein